MIKVFNVLIFVNYGLFLLFFLLSFYFIFFMIMNYKKKEKKWFKYIFNDCCFLLFVFVYVGFFLIFLGKFYKM